MHFCSLGAKTYQFSYGTKAPLGIDIAKNIVAASQGKPQTEHKRAAGIDG